jgi:tetratricopeptide (TPR) repeat protein
VLALKDDKQYILALSQLNVLINQYPEDIRNYQIKGELTYLLKMYQEALETYDQLLALTTIN